MTSPPQSTDPSLINRDAAEGDLILQFANSEHAGQWLRLQQPTVSIGSSTQCQLSLRSPRVRDLHAVIFRGKAKTLLKAFADDTRHNGTPVAYAELSQGDTLSIGPIDLFVTSLSQPTHVRPRPSGFVAGTKEDRDAEMEAWENALRKAERSRQLAIAKTRRLSEDLRVAHEKLSHQEAALQSQTENLAASCNATAKLEQRLSELESQMTALAEAALAAAISTQQPTQSSIENDQFSDPSLHEAIEQESRPLPKSDALVAEPTIDSTFNPPTDASPESTEGADDLQPSDIESIYAEALATADDSHLETESEAPEVADAESVDEIQTAEVTTASENELSVVPINETEGFDTAEIPEPTNHETVLSFDVEASPADATSRETRPESQKEDQQVAALRASLAELIEPVVESDAPEEDASVSTFEEDTVAVSCEFAEQTIESNDAALEVEEAADVDDSAQATPEDADVPATVEPTPEASREDESIEEYMAKLLQRVRGETDDEDEQPERAAAVVNAKPSSYRPGFYERREKQTLASMFAPEMAARDEEFRSDSVARREAAEAPESLAAMRELANSTARSAVAFSLHRRENSLVMLQLVGAIVCVFGGAVFLKMTSSLFSTTVLAAMGLWGMATFLIFQTVQHYRGLQAKSEEDDSEAQSRLDNSAAKAELRLGLSCENAGDKLTKPAGKPQPPQQLEAVARLTSEIATDQSAPLSPLADNKQQA